jgi:hypothetical protein
VSELRCFQFVAVLLGVLLVVPFAQADIPAAEREALIALYDSTGGASWENNDNWLGPPGSENTWYGVTTDAGNTTVKEISLYNNNLVGILPAQLAQLSNLEFLTLDRNQLSGNIPSELGNLTNLQWLYLSDNQLTGNIPAELGNLSNLLILWLNNNDLMGPIPLELMNLENLEDNESDFRYNHLCTRDDALRTFLNSKQIDGDWESYQTPPFTKAVPGIPLLLLED